MSYTAQEIHEKAIGIIDEISENGTIDVDDTKEYANRAPGLLDSWQKEMARTGSLYNIMEYVSANEATLYQWTKLTLPVNFKGIKDMLFIDNDGQFTEVENRQFGNSDIYFYFRKLGTLRVLYIPIPEKITSLANTLAIDDMTAISGAYYLAEHYAIADQNDELAKVCRNKFKELKAESITTIPFASGTILDAYNVKWGG